MGLTQVYSQSVPTCQSIELNFGQTEELDCFRLQVPVWFKYVGTGTAPASFSFCHLQSNADTHGNIIIKGNVENARIEGIVAVDPNSPFSLNFSNLYDNNGNVIEENVVFRMETTATGLDDIVNVNFGDETNPNFYLVLRVDPGESFYFENVRFLDGIAPTDDCPGNSSDCHPAIAFSGAPFSGSTTYVGSCDNGPFFDNFQSLFEYYVATDEASYDATTNTARLPVKIRSLEGVNFNGNFPQIVNLSFDIVWEDLYDNLEVVIPGDYANNSDINGTIPKVSIITNSGVTRIDVDAISTHPLDENFSFNFTGSEAKIFEFEVKGPIEPFEGGQLIFNIENSAILALDSGSATACCEIPGANDTSFDMDNYETPCGPSDFFLQTQTQETLPCEYPHVTVVLERELNATPTPTIYQMDLEIAVTTTGTLIIDGDETMAHIELAGLTANDIQISPNSIIVTYSGYWVPDFVQNNGIIRIFDIYFTGSGEVLDFWLKKSNFVYDDTANPSCALNSMELVDDPFSYEAAMCTEYGGRVQRIESGDAVTGVVITAYELDGSGNCGTAATENYTTGIDGTFNSDVCISQTGFGFSVTGGAEDPTCGVSTFDLVLISKHILGVAPFEEKWKEFAADVNGNGSVTTFDIIQIRKLILGRITEFPNTPSVRYVPCDFDWDSYPGTLPEEGCVTPNNGCDVCFDAIKMGDVNNNCSGLFSEDKPDEILYLEITDKGINSAGKYETGYRPVDFNSIVGFQLAIEEAPTKLVANTWLKEDLLVTKDNFYYADGVTRISWTDDFGSGKTLTNNKEIFGLDFTPLVSSGIGTNDFQLRNDILPARAYDYNGKVYEIRLLDNQGTPKSLNSSQSVKEALSIKAFTSGEILNLSIQSKKSQVMNLNVFNLQGQKIFNQKGSLSKGINTFKLETSRWSSGVYFINVQTEQEQITHKWIKH